MCECTVSRFHSVRLSAIPWTVAHQAPLSMGILQARILECIAMPSSKVSSRPRDQTVSLISLALAGGFFTVRATKSHSQPSSKGWVGNREPHPCQLVLGTPLPPVDQGGAQFSSVQSLSRVQLLATPQNAARQAPLSIITPGVYPNSCPLSQWCHPTISSSVVPFSSCPQSPPASESFPMSQLFAWGGQSTGVSASVSVLPKNTQDWSPLEWTVGSPCSPRDSQESSPTPQFKSINSSVLSFLHSPTLTSIHDHSKKGSVREGQIGS